VVVQLVGAFVPLAGRRGNSQSVQLEVKDWFLGDIFLLIHILHPSTVFPSLHHMMIMTNMQDGV
jgi:hypothetical protein